MEGIGFYKPCYILLYQIYRTAHTHYEKTHYNSDNPHDEYDFDLADYRLSNNTKLGPCDRSNRIKITFQISTVININFLQIMALKDYIKNDPNENK